VNTSIFSAYNESSKRQLASGITIVDSVNEPIKVLKILMEGLTPAAGAGHWVTRFHGLPVARSYSPFDLIYLDDEYCVVHNVEITQTSNFVPFKGLPTSALVLPPKSIASSKTFTGDRIALRVVEIASPPSEDAKGSPHPAQVPSQAATAPASAAKRLNITFELVQKPAAPAATPPDAVLRPAKRPKSSPPSSQPSIAPAALQNSDITSPAIPSPAVESPEILQRPKKRRSAPPSVVDSPPLLDLPAVPDSPSVVDSPPPPAVEPASQPAPDPAPVDSASPAPVTNVPDLATLAAADRAQEAAAPASPEPIPAELSAEPTQPSPPEPEPVSAEPVSADPAFADPPLAASVASVSELPPDAQSGPPVEDQPVTAIESIAPSVTEDVQPEPLPHLEPEDTLTSLPEDTDTDATASTELPLEGPTPDAILLEASSSDSPVIEGQAETPEVDKKQQRKAMNLARRWDVKLLYSVFPELHPSYRPELQMPSVDPLKHMKSEHDEARLSAKIQLLSWLYPELELETVEERQRSHRRAPRIANPGLVGYFYTSGRAEPHEIRNFSVTGFYMKTDERWLPGTVIRITLQMVDTDGSNPGDTLTLHSRVVNWDEHGGGFEFVLPGFLE
jgi:hypothetical protein